MDISEIFAHNVESIEYDDLSPQVVEMTKRSILDTLGVILGASGLIPEIKKIIELIQEANGVKESTIMGFGDKAPAWMAAFANGAMAHCLDYDDIHHEVHPSSTTVPAGFAVAEKVGGIGGKEFITAVALGNDVTCRLGLGITYALDWHLTPVLGIFGAIATACKLLRLDAGRIVDAFGIGLCQAAGTMEMCFNVGSDLRGIYPSFPAQSAVLSALMTQKGITGLKNSLEGRAGLFNVYFSGKYDRSRLIDDLGKRFEGANVGFKAWPTCACAHAYIDATLKIISDHSILPDNIEAISVIGGDLAQTLCEPLEARRQPLTSSDAKYSLPFIVAVAAEKRNVRIGDFSSMGLRDQKVLQLAEKIKPAFDRRFNSKDGVPPENYPGKIEMVTKGGAKYQKQVDFPYGHPRNPLSFQDIVAKFEDCASYAVNKLSGEQVKRMIEAITELENLNDVSEVLHALES